MKKYPIGIYLTPFFVALFFSTIFYDSVLFKLNVLKDSGGSLSSLLLCLLRKLNVGNNIPSEEIMLCKYTFSFSHLVIPLFFCPIFIIMSNIQKYNWDIKKPYREKFDKFIKSIFKKIIK